MKRVGKAPPLRQLQEWMSFVVQHPATADVAIAARGATRHFPAPEVRAGAIVKPNARMTPADRLQVYNGGYLARLVEVMTSDYGGVRHLVGEDRFRSLVADYVQAHPSRHQNLNQLGQRFPEFVRQQARLPRRAFAAELARLERAITRAFDAPEFTPLGQADLQAVRPEQWAKVRLSVNPSVQLLEFAFPVNGWFQAWRDDQPASVPRAGKTWLCVYRKDYRVWRLHLTRPAHAVLTALAAGKPLGAALALAGNSADVGKWFQDWASDGLFDAWRLGR